MSESPYLVVGGSTGIGYALVKELLNSGQEVWVISRSKGELNAFPQVKYIPFDVLADTLTKKMLPTSLAGLAYCPGSITLRPFRSLKPQQFRADYEINVIGAVNILQAAYPALKAIGSASVVLFSTVAVGQGMAYHSSIAAAKGAVEGLTRSLAAEWAPDVRVNCIAPSLTDTPLARRLLGTAEKVTASADRHPLKRVGQPEDVAQLAGFLLSSENSWITGQVIGVDGGLSVIR
ncbi:MAG: SDR family oxidoreductase [Saprospiraceae bacterium]|nr:SDR family oxidoreductase [Saprospiraceae bacterium]